MSNVGFATLSVIPSFQGFQSRLSAGVAAPMATAGKNGGKKLGDAAGKSASSSFRERFKREMKGLSPFAGVAIGAGALAFFKGAIDEASALSESGNKINVIFGKAAGTVNAFADSASEGLGQSDLQARNAAASFGVYGKAAGLAGQELAGFSTDLTALASDLASFYDTSVEDAITAIGSGLRGEAEPLRQYGVLLDDATLRQEALRQGLVATTKDALSPQNKVLAAQAVIMQQTAVAQGDFARTADGLANSSRDLQADFADMTAELGQNLLPAATATVGFLKDDALPTFETLGGFVGDAADAFGDLPAPVKASAAAFVALRLAAATGIDAGVRSKVTSLSSAMDSLRLRTMLAADAYRESRAAYRLVDGQMSYNIDRTGRLTAATRALGTAASGAGAKFSKGLSGAISLVGGPWGAALIGGTAILGHFWKEHQEAKARIESMTEALDKQSGALTKNSREIAFKALQESGAVEIAKEWGVSLEDLTSAALGHADAQARVNSQMDAYFLAAKPVEDVNRGNAQAYYGLNVEANKLREAIGGQSAEVAEAKARWREHAEAMGDSESATGGLTDATSDYAGALKSARDHVKDLIDAEEERRKNAVKNRRDQLALITTLADARKEAREGKKTLDENTKAGRENWEALLDVADQWNNSADKVRNARGAYKDMRQNFIELAEKMGATEKKAKALADRFLTLPDKKKLRIETPGMDEALSKLRLMRDLAAPGGVALETKLRGDAYGARANGGPVNAGYPYWVGERGPELVVPKQAGTVLTAEQSAAAVSGGGRTFNFNFHGVDMAAARREADHVKRTEAMGGFDF